MKNMAEENDTSTVTSGYADSAAQDTPDEESVTSQQIRAGFDQAIANTADPDTVAEMEILREYFTNDDFRQQLEQYVWEVNQ